MTKHPQARSAALTAALVIPRLICLPHQGLLVRNMALCSARVLRSRSYALTSANSLHKLCGNSKADLQIAQQAPHEMLMVKTTRNREFARELRRVCLDHNGRPFRECEVQFFQVLNILTEFNAASFFALRRSFVLLLLLLSRLQCPGVLAGTSKAKGH